MSTSNWRMPRGWTYVRYSGSNRDHEVRNPSGQSVYIPGARDVQPQPIVPNWTFPPGWTYQRWSQSLGAHQMTAPNGAPVNIPGTLNVRPNVNAPVAPAPAPPTSPATPAPQHRSRSKSRTRSEQPPPPPPDLYRTPSRTGPTPDLYRPPSRTGPPSRSQTPLLPPSRSTTPALPLPPHVRPSGHRHTQSQGGAGGSSPNVLRHKTGGVAFPKARKDDDDDYDDSDWHQIRDKDTWANPPPSLGPPISKAHKARLGHQRSQSMSAGQSNPRRVDDWRGQIADPNRPVNPTSPGRGRGEFPSPGTGRGRGTTPSPTRGRLSSMFYKLTPEGRRESKATNPSPGPKKRSRLGSLFSGRRADPSDYRDDSDPPEPGSSQEPTPPRSDPASLNTPSGSGSNEQITPPDSVREGRRRAYSHTNYGDINSRASMAVSGHPTGKGTEVQRRVAPITLRMGVDVIRTQFPDPDTKKKTRAPVPGYGHSSPGLIVIRYPKQGGSNAHSEMMLVTCDHVGEYKLPPKPVGDQITEGPPATHYVGKVSRLTDTGPAATRDVYISAIPTFQLWIPGYDIGFLRLKEEVRPVPYNMGTEIANWFARLQSELNSPDVTFGTDNSQSIRAILHGVTSCEDSFWYYPGGLSAAEQLHEMFPEPGIVVMRGITGHFRVGMIDANTANDGSYMYSMSQFNYGTTGPFWDFRYKIHWMPDREAFKFSEFGDSGGSLVWLVRGDKMYPFAIVTAKGRTLPTGGEEHWGYATGLHMAFSRLAATTDPATHSISIHGRMTATF